MFDGVGIGVGVGIRWCWFVVDVCWCWCWCRRSLVFVVGVDVSVGDQSVWVGVGPTGAVEEENRVPGSSLCASRCRCVTPTAAGAAAAAAVRTASKATHRAMHTCGIIIRSAWRLLSCESSLERNPAWCVLRDRTKRAASSRETAVDGGRG